MESTMNTKEFKMQLSFTIQEAVQATGIGRTKLYEYINSGELEAKKIGKRTIVLKHDLDSFLNNLRSYGVSESEE